MALHTLEQTPAGGGVWRGRLAGHVHGAGLDCQTLWVTQTTDQEAAML